MKIGEKIKRKEEENDLNLNRSEFGFDRDSNFWVSRGLAWPISVSGPVGDEGTGSEGASGREGEGARLIVRRSGHVDFSVNP